MSVITGTIQKATRSALRSSKAILGWRKELQAKRILEMAPQPKITIPEDDAYLKLNASAIENAHYVSKMSELLNQWINDPARADKFDKPFLRNVMESADLLEHPEIIKLALDREIIATVCEYLGQAPRLVNLLAWWTPPNATVMRSQLWHYDHRDTRQAKVFINLNDVTEEAGPLHFLSARSSLKVDKTKGYSQSRYQDEEVDQCVSANEILKATGDKGEAYIVDTARCLHYGSRGNTKDRLILMISFARLNCVNEGSGCEVLDPVRDQLVEKYFKDDPVRSFMISTHV